jgi:hypothetical protein
MTLSERQSRLLRLLAYVDQQITDWQSQLSENATDELAQLNAEQLSCLQATRRYVERRLDDALAGRY